MVPTVDDVERFEEELTEDGAVIGAAVGTFKDLFGLVARATDAPGGQALSRIQRRRLAREAVGRSELRLLAASARRAGFPAALDELISELQGALEDPAALAERAGEAGEYEREIARLYAAYEEVRAESGRRDDHAYATEDHGRAPREARCMGPAARLPLRLRRPHPGAARAPL